MHIGIGLHTGKLMLGIIGEAERFDGTVISDAVNLASRLESLTKYYGVGILVSGQTLAQIGDKSFFESRLLDRVQVKGKSEAVELHEVLVPKHSGCAEKLACRPQFQEALDGYFQGDFERSGELFATLIRECPNDHALPIDSAGQQVAGLWQGSGPALVKQPGRQGWIGIGRNPGKMGADFKMGAAGVFGVAGLAAGRPESRHGFP
jgi:hypothetical protein